VIPTDAPARGDDERAPGIHELSPLFEAVQRARIFADSKSFVDCIPQHPARAILADYLAGHAVPGFDLRLFVETHFQQPTERRIVLPRRAEIAEQIAALWLALRCEPDPEQLHSSLLPLPHPYIVPGGRFREVYYWDSYFTMLGLRESGNEAMIESMVKNFVHLIGRHGFVPNGNRTYYLSRSQPPFLAFMLELLAENDRGVLADHVEPLQAELDYWMDRTLPTRHVVVLPDGAVLNRYYDQLDTPRPEAFAEDEAVSRRAGRDAAAVCRHLRSGAESGWDFSSRWLHEPAKLESIETTHIAPVDLNCYLHQLERTLARAYATRGDVGLKRQLLVAASARRRAILKHCWCSESGFFFDYHLPSRQICPRFTLAGVTPLFCGLATDAQARSVAAALEHEFLKPGGLVTSLTVCGQQWDAPNGWAPLQWIAIRGLEAYGFTELAAEVARRWIRLNCDVYERTGRLMEKYNVVDTTLEAGGGEYPNQDGFGWTNGVLLKLMRLYGPARRASGSEARALEAAAGELISRPSGSLFTPPGPPKM